MNIAIIGAGEIGRYLALILSREKHNVILIDKDSKKLEEASWNMDIATRLGSGTDWQLLDNLLELSPELLIALTNDDETNLVACSIAKNLGYPKTIARVKDNRFLNQTRLDFARLFDVDYFIGPELLAANEILKYLLNPGSLAIESFAHGAVLLKTLHVPTKWRKFDRPLKELDLPKGIIVGLIKREMKDSSKGKIIFPHGDDVILPHDEVTLIGERDAVFEVHQFFGITQTAVESVVIAGGSTTTINLTKILEQKKITTRIIEKDYEKCCFLADHLPNSIILNHDATDFDFFKAEKIGNADAFVACTGSDELNLISALLGKEAGCGQSIAVLTNPSFATVLGRLGINYSVSPRISAVNHILSQVFSGNVSSLFSLYDNQAEILEVNVSYDSKLVGIPLADLGALLPQDFLIAMIQNRGRIMIANGSRIISPGDTVIVISSPKHLQEIETLF